MVRIVNRDINSRRSGFTLLEVMIVVAIIVVLIGAGGIYVFRYWEDAKKDTARQSAYTLAKAAQAYMLQFNALPENLDQLLSPPAGQPFVIQSTLRDPWGKPFNYDPAGPRNNGLQPDVWAIADDGTECGNWPKQ